MEFKVNDGEGVSYVVNLASRKCVCNSWEISSLPSKHAAAAISYMRGNIEEYCDVAFTNERPRKNRRREPDEDVGGIRQGRQAHSHTNATNFSWRFSSWVSGYWISVFHIRGATYPFSVSNFFFDYVGGFFCVAGAIVSQSQLLPFCFVFFVGC
ncbi:hypothetical protein F0562_021878 [Nyssa sinensis]|uniref:SWIM-type domain-containing protein n=1 Tax=Nyssa sinensis TaxID=561372 RepID=A0A5J5BLD7_9ASTE|nr:hypothetical protein F0562_021878 [Nyssa sinensis]